MGGRRLLAIGLVVALLGSCGPDPAPSTAPTTAAVSATSPASPASTIGPSAAPLPLPSPSPPPTGPPEAAACTPAEHPEWSVARRWDEALLNAIRRSLPNPPVHARNLFHLSVAMWDAWAAYDPVATGHVTTEKAQADDVAGARIVAVSYAARAVLAHRFREAVGAEESLAEFDAVLRALCLPVSATFQTDGPSSISVGNRVGRAVIARALADGSNEGDGYGSPDYQPVNAPLVVASMRRFRMADPNRWQPVEIRGGFSQNGIPTDTVQVAIGPHWGHVQAFGQSDTAAGLPIDPGPPPLLGDPATDALLKAQVIEVIRDSALLDPATALPMDVSPGALGANPLGTNDGNGHLVNPVTGRPYASRIVSSADFHRVVAEYWADGPRSETPPGHWNVISNETSDVLEAAGPLRIGGLGSTVDRLEWDVKLYLALNAALHNAAICAWALKGRYDSVRPISLIRYMGGRGQSSDPDLPSYHRHGLPLVPGVVELVTAATSAPGRRHQALAGSVGRVAILAWGGSPAKPRKQVGGSRWQLATEWVPYQLPTFVTPSFPGYVSGHSTFSRSAAEVLAQMTGSEYFPGGLAHHTVPARALAFERGPSTDVDLQWATYFDAADQAGQSRLFGGIHIQADDFAGRRIGSACGRAAWLLAVQHYGGRVVPGAQACVVAAAGESGGPDPGWPDSG